MIGVVYGGDTNLTIDEEPIHTNDNEITYALEDGDSNITFDNGMEGYCSEYMEKSANKDDMFYVENTDKLKSSNMLKIYFIDYYDKTNNYVNGEDIEKKTVNQHIVWYFTNNFKSSITLNNMEILKRINESDMKYDDIVAKGIDNETIRVWNFKYLVSPFKHHQNFFAYNVSLIKYKKPIESKNITNTNQFFNIMKMTFKFKGITIINGIVYFDNGRIDKLIIVKNKKKKLSSSKKKWK